MGFVICNRALESHLILFAYGNAISMSQMDGRFMPVLSLLDVRYAEEHKTVIAAFLRMVQSTNRRFRRTSPKSAYFNSSSAQLPISFLLLFQGFVPSQFSALSSLWIEKKNCV